MAKAWVSIGRSGLRRRVALALCLVFTYLLAGAQAQGRNEARSAVQAFFNLLKSQQYAALYDYLPGEMQKRVTREQLVQGLKRLEEFIAIERMEIGRVQQRGDFAVIDTTLYGRLKHPLTINGQTVEAGKVAVQQYLFKEGDRWKVATADNNTRALFLKRYPDFNRSFQFT